MSSICELWHSCLSGLSTCLQDARIFTCSPIPLLSPHSCTRWGLQAFTFPKAEVEAFNKRYEGVAYALQGGDTHFMTSDDIIVYFNKLLLPAMRAQRKKWKLEGRRAGLQCDDQSIVHSWFSPPIKVGGRMAIDHIAQCKVLKCITNTALNSWFNRPAHSAKPWAMNDH